MELREMYENDQGKIVIEQDDQCTRCILNRKRKPMCPLIEGLASGIFFIDGDVQVKACDLFKPRLSVVPDDHK